MLNVVDGARRGIGCIRLRDRNGNLVRARLQRTNDGWDGKSVKSPSCLRDGVELNLRIKSCSDAPES